MADISFDDIPSSGKSSDISFDDIPTEKPSALATAGRLASEAVGPITRYPSTYVRMIQGAKEEMTGGVAQMTSGGVGNAAIGAGRTGLGFMNWLGAPVGAAVHTVVGEPVSGAVEYATGSKRAGQITGDVAEIGASAALPIPKHLPTMAKTAEPLSIGKIEAAAEAGFESPEIRNTSFRSDAWTQWADTTRLYLNSKFIDETGAPKTMAALKRLRRAPAGSTVDGGVLTSFRHALGEAAKSKDNTERYAAMKAIHSLDDAITAMPPGALLSGDPQRLVEVWGKARGDWTAAKHAERIDEALETARNKASSTFSGGNIDNKMRQEIEKILDRKTERRGFTNEELEQMRRVIGRRDSVLTGAPRVLSKILGGQGGFPSVIAAGAGAAKFGPVGAMAPLAGYAMKVLGDSITSSRLDKLDRMIRARAPASQAAQQAMAAYGKAAQTIQAQPSADNMLRLFVASSLLSDAAREGGVDLGLHELVHAGSGTAIGKSDSSSENGEDAEQWHTNFEKNKAFVKPGATGFNTELSPKEEAQFKDWVRDNKVPFDPKSGVTDYDMRGFWKALTSGDPRAKSAVDPNDKRLHYPDYWKTPYHQTFSKESQWANPKTAPSWNDKDQLVAPNGTVLFDDRAPQRADASASSSSEYTSGGKHYRYKGTGDYDDVKNWEVTPVQ